MKERYQILGILIMSAFLGCAAVQISSDYEQNANFSGLNTYQWVPEPQKETSDPRLDNSLVHSRITNSVEGEMAARGFKKVTSNPDFLMGYHVAIDSKLNVTQVNDYYGYRSTFSGSSTIVSDYEQGTLILDIIDPQANQLLWRGSAQAEVSPQNTSPEKRNDRIKMVVKKILDQFPPK